MLLNDINVKMDQTSGNPTVEKAIESMVTIHNPDLSWRFGEVVRID